MSFKLELLRATGPNGVLVQAAGMTLGSAPSTMWGQGTAKTNAKVKCPVQEKSDAFSCVFASYTGPQFVPRQKSLQVDFSTSQDSAGSPNVNSNRHAPDVRVGWTDGRVRVGVGSTVRFTCLWA